ncbi:hypothetical protein OTK49_26715 [Vibrio coralliirubri]|uniref:secretin N-terminal domain-containing protein n=1 Tax=Vibrio coralliirubri TaxID=1516159 RepID=UPI0022852DC9|nr:secretin N-terminal domain-containing protein [Vibrio coralliirubri]MCY9866134.1 hypothetical protein [Vibrio coralliirubri]
MILNKSKISILVGAAFASGCSQIHTQDFKEIKETNAQASEDIDAYKAKSVAEINGGAALDEFFVKLTPIKIKTRDSIVLPDFLPTDISIYSGIPMTEAELAQMLYLDFGIKLTVSRTLVENDEASAEESEKDSTDNIETGGASMSLMDIDKGQITAAAPDSGDSSESAGGDSAQDMLALFGNNREVDNSSDTRIQKIDYSGSLVGFFDWLALARGLSWKYDADSDVFVLYDLDTVVFELIDNTDKFTFESTIDTSSDSSSGSSGGASSSTSSTTQKSTFEDEADHWADLQVMLNQMLSPNGKAAFDLKNGRVAITDTKQALEKIGTVIDQINSSSGSQILLNLTYIKVSVEETSEIGVNTNASDLISGAVTGGGSAGGGLGAFQNVFTMSFSKIGLEAAIGAIGSLGTISYRYDSPIMTMNNHLTPFQSVEEEHYIAEVESETDDDGNETLSPKKDINKTGITSTWKNRIYKDRVLVDGKISLVENLYMKELPAEMNNVVLPKNALDTHNIKAMLRNGETKVVSIQEIKRKVAESSGPFGSNSFFLGGSEKTKNRREISVIMVTPYVIK